MTTSVRLTPQLERSLSDYCKRRGVTKTEVMSSAIVDYIAKHESFLVDPANDFKAADASPIYSAFTKSGLIGTNQKEAAANGESATKARVREVVRAQMIRRPQGS